MSIQARTLNLLQDLQEEMRLTCLFISHAMSVVEYISDRVAVMYPRRIVELAEADPLFAHPLHPNTAALLASVPRPDPRSARTARQIRLTGEVADPADRPKGRAFHPRCPLATEDCRVEDPMRRNIGGHEVTCHHTEDLELEGERGHA